MLTVADAAATGPAAWSDWKAAWSAISSAVPAPPSAGRRQPEVTPLDDERRALAEAGELAVVVRQDEVVVAAPDAPRTLYRTAGVLALHSLDIREASIRTHAGMAVNRFVVAPRFGQMPDPTLVRNDLARAMQGELGLVEKLREKERTYSRAPAGGRRRGERALVRRLRRRDRGRVPRRRHDRPAVPHHPRPARRPAWTSARPGCRRWPGSSVDAFYVTDADGKPIDPPARTDVERPAAGGLGRLGPVTAPRPPGPAKFVTANTGAA